MTKSTMKSINHRFDVTGSIGDLPRLGRPRNGRSDENIKLVANQIAETPTKSTRRLGLKTGLSRSTVTRILPKNLHFKSYVPTLVQELNEDDIVVCTTPNGG